MGNDSSVTRDPAHTSLFFRPMRKVKSGMLGKQEQLDFISHQSRGGHLTVGLYVATRDFQA
jgi:hypothetical protein